MIVVAADRDRLAHPELLDSLEPPSTDQPAESPGRDDRHVTGDASHRGEMQVILVAVGDEDGVRLGREVRRSDRVAVG